MKHVWLLTAEPQLDDGSEYSVRVFANKRNAIEEMLKEIEDLEEYGDDRKFSEDRESLDRFLKSDQNSWESTCLPHEEGCLFSIYKEEVK